MGACGKGQSSSNSAAPTLAPSGGETPPIATSTSLILAWLKTQPCTTSRIDLSAIPAGQGDVSAIIAQISHLKAWIEANVANSPHYTLISAQVTSSGDDARNYKDNADGTTISTNTMLGQLGELPFGRGAVDFCSYDIENVRVLDTTRVMPKLAQITYSTTLAMSDTAKRVVADPSLGWSWNPSTIPLAGEGNVMLRRLDVGGWRVEN